jgi:molybdopterin synthase sulfur carrier subunit
MRVRFFGRLRDAIGDELDVDVPARITDCEALRQWLALDHPALLDPGVRIALDDRMAVGPAPLSGIKEAAFLPPVSGG